MRVWLENEKHIIIEGEENFLNAGFVGVQRAIPIAWVELVPSTRIATLEAQAEKDAARIEKMTERLFEVAEQLGYPYGDVEEGVPFFQAISDIQAKAVKDAERLAKLEEAETRMIHWVAKAAELEAKLSRYDALVLAAKDFVEEREWFIDARKRMRRSLSIIEKEK